jgi:hypothetical protein
MSVVRNQSSELDEHESLSLMIGADMLGKNTAGGKKEPDLVRMALMK